MAVDLQAYNREYKRQNRWRYQPRQKLYDAAKHANERAKLYGAPGEITPEEVGVVLKAGECFYCGTTTSEPWWTIDHKTPLHLGGLNRPENLVCCCSPCNISKHRADRPRKWARAHDRCRACASTDFAHSARGLCRRCYGALIDLKRGRSTVPGHRVLDALNASDLDDIARILTRRAT